jgi:hypothetical protein
VDARERRLAQNETLFREVNERIEDLALSHADEDHVYSSSASAPTPTAT